KLRRDIKHMESARRTKRARRRRNQIPSVAIAGYTNAGKSSILNRLTKAGVLVENAMFATLDPTVRAAQTDNGIAYTLSDTVGLYASCQHNWLKPFAPRWKKSMKRT